MGDNSLMTVFDLALLLAAVIILSAALAVRIGSRLGLPTLLLFLLIGSVVSIKFDWIYWWAGKLWGRGILDVQAANSPRAAKNIARVEQWAIKLGWLGIFLAYVPIPLPIAFVVFVLMVVVPFVSVVVVVLVVRCLSQTAGPL